LPGRHRVDFAGAGVAATETAVAFRTCSAVRPTLVAAVGGHAPFAVAASGGARLRPAGKGAAGTSGGGRSGGSAHAACRIRATTRAALGRATQTCVHAGRAAAPQRGLAAASALAASAGNPSARRADGPARGG